MRILVLTMLAGMACSPALAGQRPAAPTASSADAAESVAFFDSLHDTFQILNAVVLRAYAEHFADEPENLGIVHFYAARLAETDNDPSRAALNYAACLRLANRESYHFYHAARWITDAAANSSLAVDKVGPEITELAKSGVSGNPPQGTRHEELFTSIRRMLMQSRVAELDQALAELGSTPHRVLHRSTANSPAVPVAECPLFDSDLLRAHRQLWELRGGIAEARPVGSAQQAIDTSRARIQSLRAQPDQRELSLRKFLDRHRDQVWDLGWQYRQQGNEESRRGDFESARGSYLRAWSLGEALFPPSERGRSHQFGAVFLAQLGDLYCRLDRYDLMLRYIYSDDGLPARHEMAKPVASLARIAESVRLAHHDESSNDPRFETQPETVSQILFDRVVASTESVRGVGPTSYAAATQRLRFGWILVGLGGSLVCIAAVWGFVRIWRRPRTRWMSEFEN